MKKPKAKRNVYRNKLLRDLPRQKMSDRELRILLLAEQAFKADGQNYFLEQLAYVMRTRDLWVNDSTVFEAALLRVERINEKQTAQGKRAAAGLAMLRRDKQPRGRK